MNKEKKILRLKDGDRIVIKKDLKEHLMLFGFPEKHADKVARIIFLHDLTNVDIERFPDDERVKKKAQDLMNDFLDKNHKNRTDPMLLLKLLFDVIRKVSDHYFVIESNVEGRYT